MKPLNSVISACPPSGIRRFFDIAAQRADVISLGVGEPDFVTPWRVREAGIYALEHGATTYTSNAGLPKLRELICAELAGRYGARYAPDGNCVITAGVSEGLDLTLRVLLEPGEEVIVPEPCYVAYQPCVSFAGGRPVPVPTSAEDGFRLRCDVIEAAVTERTKAILIGSPANPTGAVQTREDLAALVALAEKHDLYLISDEIYDRLTYTGTHTCLATLPGAMERTVLLGGFSKAHAMTGWRVGYMAAPAAILEGIVKVHQYGIMSAPTTAQDAALEAIVGGEADVERMLAEYDRRRRLIVDGLNAIGLRTFEPRGAFYAFPEVTSTTGLTSEEFAQGLLAEERVAVIPGSAFGPSGEGHVRACYATSYERLEDAVGRIGRFVERHRAA